MSAILHYISYSCGVYDYRQPQLNLTLSVAIKEMKSRHTMLRTITVVILLLFLSACSTLSEPTAEEKAQQEEKAAALREKLDTKASELADAAVTPILNLIDDSITFYEEKKKWPEANNIPGDASQFLSYQTTESTTDKHVSEFRLKSMELNWKLELKNTGVKEEGKNLYHASLRGTDDMGYLHSAVNGLKATRGISAVNTEKKMVLARMLALIDVATDNIQENKQDAPTSKLNKIAVMIVGVKLCAQLGVLPSECRLRMIPLNDVDESAKTSKEKKKIEAQLKNKLKEIRTSDK